jgi:hypothetical protein
VITPNDGIGATGCTTMMPYMTRFQSVSERRSFCGAADAVAVGKVDMGLFFTREGLYEPLPVTDIPRS